VIFGGLFWEPDDVNEEAEGEWSFLDDNWGQFL
jgi:hypothetical protein